MGRDAERVDELRDGLEVLRKLLALRVNTRGLEFVPRVYGRVDYFLRRLIEVLRDGLLEVKLLHPPVPSKVHLGSGCTGSDF